jgi:hypothetical protein
MRLIQIHAGTHTTWPSAIQRLALRGPDLDRQGVSRGVDQCVRADHAALRISPLRPEGLA